MKLVSELLSSHSDEGEKKFQADSIRIHYSAEKPEDPEANPRTTGWERR